MPSDNWCQVKVSDVAADERNALVGGPFGSNLVSRDYVDHGVPVIRGQNMGERWVGGDFAYVTRDKAYSLSANLARPGDIIFTQRGTLGQVALVPPSPFDLYLISQSQMKLTVNQAVADPFFLYYQFRSPEHQDYVHRNAIQTGVPHTNLGILRDTPITLPSLLEQKAIARMLCGLDDKIELNRRMNQTLEEMAQAIFQSWLVNFDPVRARAAGRQPAGLAPHIVELFPNRFEQCQWGEVPQGWLVRPLDAVANYQNGLALQRYPPESEESLPVIKIRELRQGASDEKSDKASPNIREDCIIEDGDIIFSWSGSLLVEIWCGGRGALNQHLFRVTSDEYPRWFYYHWTKYHLPEFEQIAADKATTMGHIKRQHLSEAFVVVPPDPVLEAAGQIIDPLIQRIVSNSLQSRTLVEVRDTLLPKLISGELRVPDAERLVEENL